MALARTAGDLQPSRDSIFAARELELLEMADKMPKTLTGNYPYLMEIRTGIIHPYIPTLAERSDLVVGCYNLSGSQNPADADPTYDPQSLAMRDEQRSRVIAQAPARTAADLKAQQAELIAEARREERERVEAELRAEYEAKLKVETAPVEVEAKPKLKPKASKGKKAAEPVQVSEPSIEDQILSAAASVALDCEVAPGPDPLPAVNEPDADELKAAFASVID